MMEESFTMGPAWPVYIMFFLFFTFQCIGGPLQWVLKCCLGIDEDDKEEQIPLYHEALNKKDK